MNQIDLKLNFLQHILNNSKSTNVREEVVRMEAPSTNVSIFYRVIGFPNFRELYSEGEPRGSNPMRLIYGAIWLK